MSVKYYHFNSVPLGLLSGGLSSDAQLSKQSLTKSNTMNKSEESRHPSESILSPKTMAGVNVSSNPSPLSVDHPTLVKVTSHKTGSLNGALTFSNFDITTPFGKTTPFTQKAIKKVHVLKRRDSTEICINKKACLEIEKSSATMHQQEIETSNESESIVSSIENTGVTELSNSSKTTPVSVAKTSALKLLCNRESTEETDNQKLPVSPDIEKIPAFKISLDKSDAVINCDNELSSVDQSKDSIDNKSPKVVQVLPEAVGTSKEYDSSKLVQTTSIVDFLNSSWDSKTNHGEKTKVFDNSSKVIVQSMTTIESGNAISDNVSTNNGETKVDNKSKVVVQVMPMLNFGSIAGLQHGATVAKNQNSQFEAGQGSSVVNRFTDMKEILGLGEKTRHHSGSSLGEKDSFSKYAVKRKIRKNHELNFHIRSGQGIRLSEIDYVVAEVEKASPILLRILHYVLFNAYGICNDETLLSQTKQSILYFSGFPFPENTDVYQMKRKCLSRVPYPMLSGMCNILLGKAPRTREDTVEDLLRFLMKPFYDMKAKHNWKLGQEELAFDSSEEVKERALPGLSPVVLIPKLEDSYVKKLLKEMQSSTPLNHKSNKDNPSDYEKPNYVLPGAGSKLKSFPSVTVRIHNARRRIINLLHSLLYCRPGSDTVNRLNILEFSGFASNEKHSLLRRSAFLRRLKNKELAQVCEIFSLRVKSGNKTHKIMALLQFLSAPSSIKIAKKTGKELLCRSKQLSARIQERKSQNEKRIESPSCPTVKLKDFERICYNIECSPPEGLVELNDLLFQKPCDISEIHERILEFTPIANDENSSEFHSRRTLLHYMSFDVIKKIAYLLDIVNWPMYSNPNDLATDILKFLMEMKPLVQKKKRLTPFLERRQMKPVYQAAQYPHSSMVRNDENHCLEMTYNGDHASPNPSLSSSVFQENEMQDENSNVVIHRISESSYSFMTPKNNEPLTISDSLSDESLSLCDFIHHPTEKEIEVTIKNILYTDTWLTTMGDLMNKVFLCYPKLNLSYRINFIKAKALEIIHEMQRKSSIDVDP